MSTENPTNLFRVDGLVAVITGGHSGIGLMMVNALIAAGASKVFILGRRKDVLEKVASNSDTIVPVQCDVSSKSQLQEAVNVVKSHTKYVDLLAINAGILGPDNKKARQISETATESSSSSAVLQIQEQLLEASDEDWAKTFAINSTGVLLTAASFLDLLDEGNKRRKQDAVVASSQIITTTSIAGFNRKITHGLAYSASKAAANHLAKMLATLLAPVHIRSNVIAPGIYPSDMTGDVGKKEYLAAEIPEGRSGTVEDMTGAILFMASRAGAYLNGTVLTTDGGRLGVFPATY